MNDDMFDGVARHFVATVQTQAGIQAFIRKAADVLAEVGRASSKATGDHPATAIRRWTDVLREEAIRLATKPIEKPLAIEALTIEVEE